MRLRTVAITRDEAKAFVLEHHRHHLPHVADRVCIGARFDGEEQLHGVVVLGRPVARGFSQRTHAEVLRMCSDGTRNVCSLLYSAAARCAAAIGYESSPTSSRTRAAPRCELPDGSLTV